MLDYENLRTGTGGSVRAYSRDDIADTIAQMDARKDHPDNDPGIVVDDAEPTPAQLADQVIARNRGGN